MKINQKKADSLGKTRETFAQTGLNVGLQKNQWSRFLVANVGKKP